MEPKISLWKEDCIAVIAILFCMFVLPYIVLSLEVVRP